MAIKTQKTHIYALIDGVIERIQCYVGAGFGRDSFGKIDNSCLDADTKRYVRGMRDPGEGSLQIQLDDTNPSHLKILQLAESGEETEWFFGSSHAETAPTYDASTGADLPGDRIWWSFTGYLNEAAPDDLAADSLVTYSYTIVRTSKVTTTPRDL